MKKSALIVDDEVKECELISRLLVRHGFATDVAHNGQEAIARANALKPDIILLDIRMPVMDGLSALPKLKEDHPETEIIMTTAMTDTDTAIACLKAGAYGYQIKPLNLESLLGEINKALRHQELERENRAYRENLEKMVEERTAEVNQLHEELKESFKKSVRILISLMETYDPYLGGHSKRVAFWATSIGEQLKMTEKDLYDLEMAALLHDIGTIGIPDELKTRPFSEMNDKDIELLKKHPMFAQGILAPASEFTRVGVLVRHHLERMDGAGFPDGLAVNKIPLGSRIICVANAFDEVRTRRRFTGEKFERGVAHKDFAIAHLLKHADTHFDRAIISALEAVLDRVQHEKLNQILLPVDQLKAGMVLATDLFRKDGKLLLSKKHELNAIILMKVKGLANMGLLQETVYVYKPGSKTELSG